MKAPTIRNPFAAQPLPEQPEMPDDAPLPVRKRLIQIRFRE
mgnify:CR=1 FL=1